MTISRSTMKVNLKVQIVWAIINQRIGGLRLLKRVRYVPTYSARNLIVFSTFLFIFADSCNDSPKILYRGQNSQGKVLRLLLSVGDNHKGSQGGYILENIGSLTLDPFPTCGIKKIAMVKNGFFMALCTSLLWGNEIIHPFDIFCLPIFALHNKTE